MPFLFADYALDIEPARADAGIRAGFDRAAGVRFAGVFGRRTATAWSVRMICSKASGVGGSFPNSTLTSHINAARKAIGDSGDEQQLIRTVARKGFRFVGEVKEENATAAGSSARPLPASGVRASWRFQTSRRLPSCRSRI